MSILFETMSKPASVDFDGIPDDKARFSTYAFYLPQYHPIPENDEWWGKGFTEWTNTAKARPLFRGHYQPRIPADLGCYDLRVPETRIAQAELARAYGIDGFCYYHYWFAGRRILERPLREVLESGEPDFPFMVCWANQTWSGIWHGEPDRVLIEQTYPGEDDHRRHFEALLPLFLDRRYATVEGRPIFVIYRPQEIPQARRVFALWREMAQAAGLPGLHLVGARMLHDRWTLEELDLDASVDHRLPPLRPHGGSPRRPRSWKPKRWLRTKYQKYAGLPTIYDYSEVIDGLISREGPSARNYSPRLSFAPRTSVLAIPRRFSIAFPAIPSMRQVKRPPTVRLTASIAQRTSRSICRSPCIGSPRR
ncbi:glycoside hydrolase family 99-like domain-containing protein [Roseibacterium sp. SDUM158017]|nr:glycoside hydrolase family 99-like domain-containing protein [Roseibacterium sp. SDUM158017]MDG4648525.1 glycoside hydrolase family 99-like domain-containing protein [Roseibacterium sp. SDUM158017]